MFEVSRVNCILKTKFQLEQMELEIKELPGKDKQKYRTRLTSYKAELSKLQADLVSILHTLKVLFIAVCI